ncbi:hypothetical protein QBC34DRAFT_304345 [Podospora aff. communis PSN243]|uniref:AB hydrolase-1 domain-containing protein n=1 Tax=Podospora aff. communis PSN243 TaxID=3040156 RepID=A0AAV9GEH1_9PEZI|nr:hypothetical protein QBC34DRAFT_304345 [Podospora aff. communis PSN243]
MPSISLPSPHKSNAQRQRVLIYFIPGNPGLIAYYHPFLTTLRTLLNDSESRPDSKTTYHIHGQTLLGFSDADHPSPFNAQTNPPFTLEDQILHTSATLASISSGYSKVLLIGHSVGAYIAIESFHRHHISPNPNPSLNLHSAILLFPTISHIAQSPNGRRLTAVANNSFLDRNAHRLARWFLYLWPAWLLYAFLRAVLRLPAEGAKVTAAWLKSRDGIWQALHMGKDEMRTITEERWKEDLWEGGEEKDKFVFLFGRGDRWVADECRDEFVERRRGSEKGRVRVVVDEGGLPHAFCLRHSEVVAEKVREWVVDMVGV